MLTYNTTANVATENPFEARASIEVTRKKASFSSSTQMTREYIEARTGPDSTFCDCTLSRLFAQPNRVVNDQATGFSHCAEVTEVEHSNRYRSLRFDAAAGRLDERRWTKCSVVCQAGQNPLTRVCAFVADRNCYCDEAHTRRSSSISRATVLVPLCVYRKLCSATIILWPSCTRRSDISSQRSYR